MDNSTNNQEINETIKKEWVKPEMIEIEVMFSAGAMGDGEGAS